MFSGFSLEIRNEDFFSYKVKGDEQFNSNKRIIEAEIDKFMFKDGAIDGSAMQESWFPQINADIFISHSHADEDQAIAFAGWIKGEFGLNAFIDSSVWGYADKLLKKIDDEFCKNPDGSTYSYEKRNNSTSHVHMMLSTALTMMIDKTECVIFLNTPNSIDSTEVINRTKSPWIYYEIGVTKSIRKKEPEERLKEIIKKGIFENAQALSIKYNLDIDHLSEIDHSDLLDWKRASIATKDEHPLDTLYKKHGLLGY
ncbi:hypothetical protein [Paenibacillus odorifer]|uniref:TIR domain-containing protein n=1 Tax=Paenibacillus odorifer TaxID=189426 RepID=A0AAD0KG89_9BACL|nr:hypothetical protein [Paenibacillus odorifer]AWV31315.1 hypothetical protein CD191_01020 [Paenibacillus odorifer]